jgi:hypothetical protein
VDRVVGREPGGHEARLHVAQLLRDRGQLGQRLAIELALAAEGDRVVEDRLVDAERDGGQVRAAVERARGVGDFDPLPLVADPVRARPRTP